MISPEIHLHRRGVPVHLLLHRLQAGEAADRAQVAVEGQLHLFSVEVTAVAGEIGLHCEARILIHRGAGAHTGYPQMGLPVEAAQRGVDAGGGQGGFWPAESESVPDGASTQDYTLASQPVRPAQGAVTSAFGFRENPVNGEDDFHAGIDIAAAAGTQAVSALDGQVCRTARSDVRGNYVVVRHADGVRTLYQHLACAVVREGESVRAGQPVGLVGETGLVTGPHLHFEMMVDGVLVDPQKSLPAQAAA